MGVKRGEQQGKPGKSYTVIDSLDIGANRRAVLAVSDYGAWPYKCWIEPIETERPQYRYAFDCYPKLQKALARYEHLCRSAVEVAHAGDASS